MKEIKEIYLNKQRFFALADNVHIIVRPEDPENFDIIPHLVGKISSDPTERQEQWNLIKKNGMHMSRCEIYSDIEEYKREIKEILPIDISPRITVPDLCNQTNKMLEDLYMRVPTNLTVSTQFKEMIETINRIKNYPDPAEIK